MAYIWYNSKNILSLSFSLYHIFLCEIDVCFGALSKQEKTFSSLATDFSILTYGA